MKVLLTAPMSLYSGYGRDGIGLAQAMLRAGLDVYLKPTGVDPPLPDEITDLLRKRLEAPFDLAVVHVDPCNVELSPHLKDGAIETAVAWSMWENTSFDNAPKKAQKTLTKRLRPFDVFLSYDNVTDQAMKPYLEKAQVHSGVIQGGYDAEFWQPAAERDWFSDRFMFIMVGQLNERKNPFVAVQAFKELKDEYPEEFEPARLALKTMVPGLHPLMEKWCPGLKIFYDSWPEETLKKFYHSAHVLLAPSRGEGKNLPALEMMTTGGAVIASDFGGHQNWLSDEYAYRLSCDLRGMPGKPECKSAHASLEHLKSLMLHTFRNRDEVKHKGEVAARVIPDMCNWDAVLDRFFLTIRNREMTQKGERLWQQYRESISKVD